MDRLASRCTSIPSDVPGMSILTVTCLPSKNERRASSFCAAAGAAGASSMATPAVTVIIRIDGRTAPIMRLLALLIFRGLAAPPLPLVLAPPAASEFDGENTDDEQANKQKSLHGSIGLAICWVIGTYRHIRHVLSPARPGTQPVAECRAGSSRCDNELRRRTSSRCHMYLIVTPGWWRRHPK